VIASDSEEAIYRALDLPLIPAPMREDRGEIEAAEQGVLPAALRLADVRGDLHVHTTLSGDGRSTLEEIVASAAERGYEYLALTDHAENLAMSGVNREALARQRQQIDALRGRYPSMTLLHGSELNIGRDGSVDYDPGFRRTLEWRVAGVHSHFDLGREEQTQRILKAMEDPTVDAIAHLSGRRIGRRPGIDLDIEAVLEKAVATNTAIEINASLGRLDASSEVLLRARGMDVTFVLSTDTHHTRELARMAWGVLHATRGWVDQSRIANFWPRERFLGWLQRSPELRPRRRDVSRLPACRRRTAPAGARASCSGRSRATTSAAGFMARKARPSARSSPSSAASTSAASSPTRGPSPGLRRRRRHPRDHAVRRAGLARAPAARARPRALRRVAGRRRRAALPPPARAAPGGARAVLGRDRGGAAGSVASPKYVQLLTAVLGRSRRLPVGLRGARRHEPRRPDAALRGRGPRAGVRPARGRRAPRPRPARPASREGEDSEVG
jgi:histidinol phosphatase-like PHP family hydrolase